jgi:hypothetical protein
MTTPGNSPARLALDGMLTARQKCQGAQLAFLVATMERLVGTLSTEAQARERVIQEQTTEVMWRQTCLRPQLRLGSRISASREDSPILVEGAHVSEGMDAEIWVIYQNNDVAAEADVAAADVVDIVDIVDIIVL